MKRTPLGFAGLFASVLCLAVAPLVFGQTNATAPKTDKPAGNVQNGKQLYTSDGCFECHDRAAQGGVGPRLGPHPLPLTAFISYVRHPAAEMPPYTAKVISDAELNDIYAFLQSLPDPPKPDSIPLLKDR